MKYIDNICSGVALSADNLFVGIHEGLDRISADLESLPDVCFLSNLVGTLCAP